MRGNFLYCLFGKCFGHDSTRGIAESTRWLTRSCIHVLAVLASILICPRETGEICVLFKLNSKIAR